VRESRPVPCRLPSGWLALTTRLKSCAMVLRGRRLSLGRRWLSAECGGLLGVGVSGQRHWVGDEPISRPPLRHVQLLHVDIGCRNDLHVFRQPEEERPRLVRVAP